MCPNLLGLSTICILLDNSHNSKREIEGIQGIDKCAGKELGAGISNRRTGVYEVRDPRSSRSISSRVLPLVSLTRDLMKRRPKTLIPA